MFKHLYLFIMSCIGVCIVCATFIIFSLSALMEQTFRGNSNKTIEILERFILFLDRKLFHKLN